MYPEVNRLLFPGCECCALAPQNFNSLPLCGLSLLVYGEKSGAAVAPGTHLNSPVYQLPRQNATTVPDAH